MKQLTDLIHLLLCQEQHIYDMMKVKDRHDGICYFYLEEQIASDSPQCDHVKWEKIVENFKNSLDLKSDDEALEFLREVLSMTQKLGALVNRKENRLNFIMELLL